MTFKVGLVIKTKSNLERRLESGVLKLILRRKMVFQAGMLTVLILLIQQIMFRYHGSVGIILKMA